MIRNVNSMGPEKKPIGLHATLFASNRISRRPSLRLSEYGLIHSDGPMPESASIRWSNFACTFGRWLSIACHSVTTSESALTRYALNFHGTKCISNLRLSI